MKASTLRACSFSCPPPLGRVSTSSRSLPPQGSPIASPSQPHPGADGLAQRLPLPPPGGAGAVQDQSVHEGKQLLGPSLRLGVTGHVGFPKLFANSAFEQTQLMESVFRHPTHGGNPLLKSTIRNTVPPSHVAKLGAGRALRGKSGDSPASAPKKASLAATLTWGSVFSRLARLMPLMSFTYSARVSLPGWSQ